jgi:cytoskeleton protein RodZ
MNDAQVSGEIDAVQLPLTAGAMLRTAREAAGLHIAALAVSMKVSVKKLEALEQDRVDPLLEPVFVRALACSVCRALKIDPAPVLEKLPQNQIPRLNTLEVGKNSPFRASGQTPGMFTSTNFAKPVFFVVPSLLIGISAVLFFPEIKTADTLASPDRPASSQVIVSAAPEVVLAKTEAVDVVSPGVAALATATSVATLVPEAPTPATLMVFKATGASWVEVVDGSGVVQLRRILTVGETVPISGVLPLAVVVGRTDAVAIEVRGKAFDSANISKDGVARFEVK